LVELSGRLPRKALHLYLLTRPAVNARLKFGRDRWRVESLPCRRGPRVWVPGDVTDS